MKHKVYLSLGSNMGNRHENILRACRLIAAQTGEVGAVSSFLETEPWGFQSDNMFVNACAEVYTELKPHDLLEATQAIEREMGRTEKSHDGVYHDRIIDIDILLYDRERISEPLLTIPHPLMLKRDFVMRPLREILPDASEIVKKILSGK